MLAGGLLFLATAAVVLWQNAHLAVLWDLSYVLETSLRLAQGQMPYRDFPLVHPPLTFAVQALLIRIFGRHMLVHALYAACAGGFGSVLGWRILLGQLRAGEKPCAFAWTLSLLLAAPLTVLGIYCILPHPSYDCDTALAVLVSLFFLQRLDRPGAGVKAGLIAGATAVFPSFYKQNIGLPYLFAVLLLGLLLLLKSRLHSAADRALRRKFFALLAGAGAMLAAALLALQLAAGLGNYFYWTVRFAGQRRMPGLGLMLGVYNCPQLYWALPCTLAGALLLRGPWSARPWAKTRWLQLAAMVLLAAPWLYVLAELSTNLDDPDSFGDAFLSLWPLVLVFAEVLLALRLFRLFRDRAERPRVAPLLTLVTLGAIHGTLMSQQLWGSTYALWPFFLFLLADGLLWLGAPRSKEIVLPMLGSATLASLTLLLAGGYYTASEERLSYVDLAGGPPQHAATPALRGLATPGPYLANLDELLRYAEAKIPSNEAIVLLPGEDPFYFATGRRVQFPVLLFDPSTDPYTPADVLRLADERQVKWLIVQRVEQIHADPTPERAATLALLRRHFLLAAHLAGYDVYRR